MLRDFELTNGEDFETRNRAEWSAAIRNAFGVVPPESERWTDRDAMIRVLTPFMGANLNHTMLPRHGGLSMESIARATEPDCLEFSLRAGCAILFRPAILFFEHIPESAWNSFFLIETQPLKPCGVPHAGDTCSEQVCEIAPGEYVDRSHWDEGSLGYDNEDREIPLPTECRIVSRFLRGKFLIVAKCSDWNGVSATYDGRHDDMTATQIREQIQNGRIDSERTR